RDLEPQRAVDVPAVVERHGQERAGEPGHAGTRMGVRQRRPGLGACRGAAGDAGTRGDRGEHGRGGRRDPGREFHATEHTPAPYPVVIRPVSGWPAGPVKMVVWRLAIPETARDAGGMAAAGG